MVNSKNEQMTFSCKGTRRDGGLTHRQLLQLTDLTGQEACSVNKKENPEIPQYIPSVCLCLPQSTQHTPQANIPAPMCGDVRLDQHTDLATWGYLAFNS